MKKSISILLLLVITVSLLSGCSKAKEAEVSEPTQPDLVKIRSICELATLECYYHNVAKATKASKYNKNKTREFWIEYDGIVKLGVDMAKVTLSLDEKTVTITMPNSSVLSVTVDPASYSTDSFIMSKDTTWGFNSNEITAEDATAAINAAKDQMAVTAAANYSLLINAQNRAMKLIENYVNQLGDINGLHYNIVWDFIDEAPASTEETSESSVTEESSSD